MTDGSLAVPAAYVVFRRDRDGHAEVLLQPRRGSGYMDRFLSTAAAGYASRGFGARGRLPERSRGIGVPASTSTTWCRCGPCPALPATATRSTSGSTSSSRCAAGGANHAWWRRTRRPSSPLPPRRAAGPGGVARAVRARPAPRRRPRAGRHVRRLSRHVRSEASLSAPTSLAESTADPARVDLEVARGDPAPGAVARRRGSSTPPTASARPATASRSAATRRPAPRWSSAMTALWFAHLDAEDRVAVKPHASPVLPRDPVPARQPRPLLPDHAARPRRPAVVPEPDQGPRRGRLLHRLGRPRRRGAAVRRGHPPLRRRALRRRATAQPVRRADRRRRARRGQHLGGDRRPGHPGPRQRDVGRRLQPAVAGPGRPGRPDRPVARPVRRPPAGTWSRSSTARRLRRGVRAARRRGAARLDRRDAERAVPVAVRADGPAELRKHVPRRRARRGRRTCCRGRARRRAGRARHRPRRPRPGRHARRVRPSATR